MILKLCGKCKRPVVYPLRYCESCLPIAQKDQEESTAKSKQMSHKRYDSKRDPKYTKFYNSPEWRTLSSTYKRDHLYRCEYCNQAIATQVDHVIEIQTNEGWERRLDYSNLKNTCDRCHNKKHKRFGFS